jgi:RNA recognition motif-containing protein
MTPPTVKIYVGNIPSSARNSELKELFEKFGKVVECDILKDYGFVHMSDTNDAKAAIAGLNDTLWKGGRVRVELSTTKTSKGKPAQRNNMKNNNGPNDRYNNNNNMNGGGRNNYPMHRGGGSRPAPYPRDNFHHHPYGGGGMNNGGPDMGPRGRNGGGGGGGPMRGSDNRYNGRYMQGQMPDRSGGRPLPYSDQFDRNGRGPMPSHNGMSNGNGMNGGGSQRNDYSYRNGGGSDNRDHRNGGSGFSNGGNMDHPPYMRGGAPHMPPPPHQLPPPGSMPPHMHDDYYRGAPPMGPPR